MKRFSLKSLAVVGIAALALTACGGSGEDDALNVGQTSNSVAFFPLHVAEENGYFDDEGVTLGDRPRLQTGARLAAALTSDSIDVAAGVATDAFNFADNDDDALITGALVTEYYVDIVVGNDFDGASEDDSLEDKIRSLEGKTIGITGPGSGTEALLIYLFNEVGLDANADATLVNLDASPSAAIGALENDQIDAFSFFQPAGQMAETSGVGEIYISPQRGDVPSLAEQVHGMVFSSRTALEEKPEQLEGFNNAINRALEFIATEPEETRTLLGEYLDGADEATLDAIVEILPQEMASSTTIGRDSFQTATNFHTESGLLDTEFSYDEIVWDEVQE